MQSDVNGRVAMVSAATGEVGAAIARELAARGARLALCAAEQSALDSTAGQLGPADVMTMQVDAADAAAVAACVARVVERFGRIDILVNNAIEVRGKALAELDAADVAGAIGTGLGAPLHFMREVVPHMQRNGFGRVVNVSDIGYLGLPRQANVAAARSGLFGLTRSAALESARDGVTVNTVVQGDIATDATTTEERDRIAAGIPVKRLGTPTELARAVGFFASDAARYVTGQTLFVCGGKSAYFSMSV